MDLKTENGLFYRLCLHMKFVFCWNCLVGSLSVVMALVCPEKAASFRDAFIHSHYVDVSIADIIFSGPSDETTNFISGNRITFPESANISDLVNLAHECDRAVYESEALVKDASYIADFEVALSKFAEQHAGESRACFIATLLALNGLESAIRQATGYRSGHAPLLKTMIQELPEPRVFELLLTPAALNMRNLLWHGFLVALPRCWLSLVLILTQSLLTSQDKKAIAPKPCNQLDLYSITQVDSVLFGTSINLLAKPSTLNRDQGLSTWLQESHLTLYRNYIQPWIDSRQYPATCCALLSILVEHGLRLRWCMANERPLDTVARCDQLYVTLDGHGQRQTHDLLLHPYLLDGSKNRLITDDLASIMALLTDLFCSSSGGPNIRACVSHGSWDSWVVEEWTSPRHSSEGHLLWRTVEILVFAMDALETNTPITYQPQFSYTAVTRKSLLEIQSNLKQLIHFPEFSSVYHEYSERDHSLFGDGLASAIPPELLSLQDHLDLLVVQDPLLRALPADWNRDLFFAEHALNQKLADLGLVRSLFEDVAAASHQLLQDLNHALQEYPTLSARKKKSVLRFVYVSCPMAIHLYTLAYNVAALSLNVSDKDSNGTDLDLKKALERTRMVVSTTQTLLREKADRARNAIVAYSKGKAIRQVCRIIAGHLGQN
jgi:hypothetical protein